MLTNSELRDRTTVTVVEAGTVLGLGREAAYRAAAAGQIPTIRLGRRLIVPVASLLRMLDIDASGDNSQPSTSASA